MQESILDLLVKVRVGNPAHLRLDFVKPECEHLVMHDDESSVWPAPGASERTDRLLFATSWRVHALTLTRFQIALEDAGLPHYFNLFSISVGQILPEAQMTFTLVLQPMQRIVGQHNAARHNKGAP